MDMYLIDYENTHQDGLKGIGSVMADSRIAIFYSGDPPAIEKLKKLREEHPGVRLQFFKHSKVYKNYEDFQLCTYLGFLAHEPGARNDRFRVITRDHGFDAVVDFWRSVGLDISRQETICGDLLPGTEADTANKKKQAVTAAKKLQKYKVSAAKRFTDPYRKSVRKKVRDLKIKPDEYEKIYEAAEKADSLDSFRSRLEQNISGGKGMTVYSRVKAVYENFRAAET